jgi:hypothetical protein
MKGRSIDFGGPNFGDFASEVLVLYPTGVKVERDRPLALLFLDFQRDWLVIRGTIREDF